MPVMDFPTSPVNGQTTTDGRYYFDSSVGSTGAWRSTPLPVGGLPAGSIMAWGTNTPPANWLLADGSAVSRSVYSSLFAVIGTQYGAGDGTSTFNLPDLRGRVPVGRNGGTFGTLGATGGAETHTLTEAQMPSHFHTTTGNTGYPGIYRDYTGPATNHGTLGLSTSTQAVANPYATNSVGSGQAHNNLQPYQVVNYIIKFSAGWTAGDSELATRLGVVELGKAPIASPVFTGNVSKAQQSSFHVYSSSGYISAGSWQNITRLPNSGGTATATVDYNIGSNWNSANGRYTAPISGRYHFYVGGWASYNGAGNRYAFSFPVNGGGYLFIGGGGTTAADSPIVGYSVTLNLAAGDYVELHMFSSVAMAIGGTHSIHYGGYFLG